MVHLTDVSGPVSATLRVAHPYRQNPARVDRVRVDKQYTHSLASAGQWQPRIAAILARGELSKNFTVIVEATFTGPAKNIFNPYFSID
jgi:hypothetical protein